MYEIPVGTSTVDMPQWARVLSLVLQRTKFKIAHMPRLFSLFTVSGEKAVEF